MACNSSINIVDINTSSSCNKKRGILVVFWTLYNNIDWAAMEADPLQFDQTEQEILAYTMLMASVWNKITFEPTGSFYTATYTEDVDAYDILITLLFEGKGKELRNALCDNIRACKLVLHVFDRNCSERVFGVDWNGDSFNVPIDDLHFGRHLDASGQVGGDAARDEVDLVGQQDCPPVYANIGQTTFEATYL